MNVFDELMDSLLTNEGLHHKSELFEWIELLKRNTTIKVEQSPFLRSDFWFYDSKNGFITNSKNSFFSIVGIKEYLNGELINEQPIFVQNEIGYLGLICKKVNGVLHFLMQAKIEPGNINVVQISPTLQATKSNFMQTHGGKKPHYLEYFVNANPDAIILDQLQSEQSSRFLKKRNRLIILFTSKKIKEKENFRWMTLGQIKTFMKIKNLVNMNTRTLIAAIPLSLYSLTTKKKSDYFDKVSDFELYNSIIGKVNQVTLNEIYSKINKHKMFNNYHLEYTDLYSLNHWQLNATDFYSKNPFPFRLIFCDVMIEGREVLNWNQPLMKSNGMAIYGLICTISHGEKLFLLKPKHEIGTFDNLEVGPSIQFEHMDTVLNEIEGLFFQKIEKNDNILVDIILSEEGGRFYHEENRYVIIQVDDSEINISGFDGYVWSNFATLNSLIQINNTTNIQLRSLISLLEL